VKKKREEEKKRKEKEQKKEKKRKKEKHLRNVFKIARVIIRRPACESEKSITDQKGLFIYSSLLYMRFLSLYFSSFLLSRLFSPFFLSLSSV
jgi:hypothetical protein